MCPNITIKEDVVEQSADYWTRLKTRLASGSGLADVQAIEIGFVADVVQNHADQFVNWNDVAERRGRSRPQFYDWKWQQATTTDGATTVGLGTDIGPEAICYRSDLLEQAGLPSDPATLAKKWGTWEDFIAFGKQYEASPKTENAHFVDSAASIFSTAVYQGDEAYDDADGQPDVENSDGVQSAWNYATPGRRGRHHRRAPAVLRPVEQGVLQRRVRCARLPDLDDGLHPGPGRCRTTPASGTSPRSCPVAPPTGAAPGSVSRTEAANKRRGDRARRSGCPPRTSR